VLEHLTGHTVTAVSAAVKPKKTTRTVTIAKTTYSVTGGSHTTVTIKLNATGKRLLAKYHKLRAKLTATRTGSKTATATKTVTLTPSTTKPKHH
jgi:riboflavin biosynthesis pyrimidine reductase